MAEGLSAGTLVGFSMLIVVYPLKSLEVCVVTVSAAYVCSGECIAAQWERGAPVSW